MITASDDVSRTISLATSVAVTGLLLAGLGTAWWLSQDRSASPSYSPSQPFDRTESGYPYSYSGSVPQASHHDSAGSTNAYASQGPQPQGWFQRMKAKTKSTLQEAEPYIPFLLV